MVTVAVKTDINKFVPSKVNVGTFDLDNQTANPLMPIAKILNPKAQFSFFFITTLYNVRETALRLNNVYILNKCSNCFVLLHLFSIFASSINHESKDRRS